ncbi:MAG TPA: SGNH/GDSL hydrolase family protein [Pyrinomonadaceae bacterium]|jgi:lysophospholipase L1-like esterase
MKFSRRDFLRYSALFLTGVAVSPKQALSFDSEDRDLQMLVLGDSVMWGQGLLEKDKFWFLTKQWLENKTDRKVAARVEAHSGATIIWRKDQKYPKDRLTTFNGELNLSTPTIMQQVENAAKYYKNPQDVDFVLVNGGANDIGIANLLNPSRNQSWMQRKTAEIFGEDMPKLLEKIYKSFPRARVVVTGYYPAISTETSTDHICNLIKAVSGIDRYEKIINKFLKFLGVKNRRFDACASDFIKEGVDRMIKTLSALSDVWQSESNRYLQQAVDNLNEKYPLAPAAGDDKRRAIFVKPHFRSQNAYAAPETYLWQVVLGEVPGNYKSNDEFYKLREQVCNCKRIRLEGFSLTKCFIAGTGHPNIAGAKKYAEAIEQEFGEVLPLTGWSN